MAGKRMEGWRGDLQEDLEFFLVVAFLDVVDNVFVDREYLHEYCSGADVFGGIIESLDLDHIVESINDDGNLEGLLLLVSECDLQKLVVELLPLVEGAFGLKVLEQLVLDVENLLGGFPALVDSLDFGGNLPEFQ